MSDRDETFEIDDVECIAESANGKSILCVIEDEEKWIPKHDRVLHDDSEVYEKGGKGKLVVFKWWAKKEGLTED
jgi:hypothetical protein